MYFKFDREEEIAQLLMKEEIPKKDQLIRTCELRMTNVGIKWGNGMDKMNRCVSIRWVPYIWKRNREKREDCIN